MVKAPQFEWNMQEDSRLKHFRSSAPPEDRAIFLRDEVGPCLEDKAPDEPSQMLFPCLRRMGYEWAGKWLDLDEMKLSDFEKLSTGHANDFLYFYYWQPVVRESKRHYIHSDFFELAYSYFSEEDEEALEDVDEAYGGKSLLERLNEAYDGRTEPKEKELLDRAAEQFGRRLSSER